MPFSVHPCRARNLRRVHFAYAVSAAVLFREDVLRAVGEDLERVLSAIRASASEASANLGMGTRFVACSGHRGMHDSAHVWEGQGLHRRHSIHGGYYYTPPVHRRHPPYPSRPHQWTIRAPDDWRPRPPVLSPSPVAFIRLSTMLSPSMGRFLHMSRLHPRASAPATPLPHPTTLLP
ncbi:hypothetical protein B0H14DRAFT_252953 [Mycena olivaceomarginata]|nr:hypothetical protein B0H14DRAFT_252953 [Mycena olivaceomarginata]